MAKYIDAEVLIKELKSAGTICDFGTFLIEKLPAADVQEVKHGKWIHVESSNTQTNKAYKCSYCKRLQYYIPCDSPMYCPNCGAKMDGKEVVKKDYNPCNKCTHKGWNMPQCQYCNKANGYKYMELDIEKFMESKNIPDRKDKDGE